MPDREKVVKGLECCTTYEACSECPYEKYQDEFCVICQDKLHNDALILLKGQKPQLIIDANSVYANGELVVHCKDCIWYDKKDPGYTTGICKMIDQMFTKDHFFCAHGFKRSEDDE